MGEVKKLGEVSGGFMMMIADWGVCALSCYATRPGLLLEKFEASVLLSGGGRFWFRLRIR